MCPAPPLPSPSSPSFSEPRPYTKISRKKMPLCGGGGQKGNFHKKKASSLTLSPPRIPRSPFCRFSAGLNHALASMRKRRRRSDTSLPSWYNAPLSLLFFRECHRYNEEKSLGSIADITQRFFCQHRKCYSVRMHEAPILTASLASTRDLTPVASPALLIRESVPRS